MHSALEIPEIVQQILLNLPRSSLPSVARTAWFLHNPAASRIWTYLNQDTIDYLADIVLKPFDVSDGPKYHMSHRWHRFQQYACLVRSVDVHFKDLHVSRRAPLRDTLRTLGLLRPAGIHLLPKLRHLSYRAMRPEDLDGVMPLLAPTLQRFWAVCETDPSKPSQDLWGVHLDSLLYRLQAECPNLNDFALFGLHRIESLYVEGLCDLVINLSLEVFATDLIALSPSLLSVLSRSQGLRELEIGDHKSRFQLPDDLLAPSMGLDRSCFPVLRKLQLEADIVNTTALLRSLRSEIEELRVQSTATEFSTRHLQEFSSSLHSASSCLTRVELLLQEPGDSIREGPQLSWDAFAEVLKCRTIVHFMLDYQSASSFDIRNGHMMSIAEAWPSLRNICIMWPARQRVAGSTHTYGGLNDENGLTLSAFTHFAIHCPGLKSLKLRSFDGIHHIPIPSSLQPSTTMTHLDVGQARVTNAGQVALFISLIWPTVKVFHHCNEVEHVKTWGAVNEMLEVIRCYTSLHTNPKLLGTFKDVPIDVAMGTLLSNSQR